MRRNGAVSFPLRSAFNGPESRAEIHDAWAAAAPGQGATHHRWDSGWRRLGCSFLVMTPGEGARSSSQARGELPTEQQPLWGRVGPRRPQQMAS